jgi:organic hydroperoxide reductase OsmC/OhrA
MLWFLFFAAKRGLVVESYVDRAIGHVERNDQGRSAVTRVVLRPTIQFAAGSPAPDELRALHDAAHHECFIANSVKTAITVEG